MSLLEQYIEEMSVDVNLDEFILKDCQMKLPGVKHKWVGRLMRTKMKLNSLYDEKRQILDTLVVKIKANSEYAMTIPAVEKLASKHESIVNINKSIQETLLAIEFLDKCEKIFHGMSFDIKNLVEIIKLETL